MFLYTKPKSPDLVLVIPGHIFFWFHVVVVAAAGGPHCVALRSTVGRAASNSKTTAQQLWDMAMHLHYPGWHSVEICRCRGCDCWQQSYSTVSVDFFGHRSIRKLTSALGSSPEASMLHHIKTSTRATHHSSEGRAPLATLRFSRVSRLVLCAPFWVLHVLAHRFICELKTDENLAGNKKQAE